MIVDFEKLSTIARDRQIIYIRGSFDLLHPGHIKFIQFAKQQKGILVVGVIPDSVVSRRKGSNRPITDQANRLFMINALKDVDFCFITPVATSEKSSIELVIEALRPAVIVQYDDGGDKVEHFKKIVESYGVRFVADNSEKLQSTTTIIKKIRDRHQT